MRTLGRLQELRHAKDVTVEAVGSISVRMYEPASGVTAPSPALLWIHGGGYVMGTAAMDDAVCRHFARELGIVVASVDYRLAPEFPFPTPLHDCHDALAWLAGRPEVDATRIAIGGASAGAGLAAPARYEDLSGLPPAWIGTGALDLFYEEDISYANRLTAAGVTCEQLVVEGAFHGFDLMRPGAGVSREFRAAQTRALAAVLN